MTANALNKCTSNFRAFKYAFQLFCLLIHVLVVRRILQITLMQISRACHEMPEIVNIYGMCEFVMRGFLHKKIFRLFFENCQKFFMNNRIHCL